MTYNIIVEIPHQAPAQAWIGTDADIISRAYEVDNWGYSKMTRADLEDCYGEDAPDEALELLKTNEMVVEITTSGNTEYLTVSDAPSKIEWAQDALFHDLNCGYIFENEAEARDFVDHVSGHQAFKAHAAVMHAMAVLGW